jgi:hypothetical protein
MIGTLSTIGGTAVGAPVDTRGFADVLATLVLGAVMGSGTGSTVTLAIKIQESASATGTNWTDITNGHLVGGEVAASFDFDTVTLTGTSPVIVMEKQYMQLRDSNRLRYIRAHATLAGTVGLGPKFSVAFLLGRPDDTLYISNAETAATGNAEYTLLR